MAARGATIAEDKAPSEGDEAWHALPEPDVIEALGTSRQGLATDEARDRLKRYGANRLKPPKRRGLLRRLLDQFNNVLIYVLMVAGAISLAIGEHVDALVIFAVVLINAAIGFVQEGKAEQALQAVMNMLAVTARVTRDGVEVLADATELVPGDIVSLQSGDRVPADLRLIETRSLSIQEAVLTGESEAAGKAVAAVSPTAPLGDRGCMAYSGTLVTYGRGVGVVVATGASTEMGRISAMLKDDKVISTPLIRQLEQFGRWLTLVIVALACATFAFGYFVRGFPPEEMFMVAVGIAVAAIPEGLPAILTIALAIGVSRMAQRNAIIRRLPAVETLGSVTVICTDKTGTLTHNEMTAQRIVWAEDEVALTGSGYRPEGDVLKGDAPVDALADPVLPRILRAGLLCSESRLEEQDGTWVTVGDPVEGALIAAAMKAGLDTGAEARQWARLDLVPFESERRYMASLNRAPGGQPVLFVKGAPETIIDMCADEAVVDGTRPLDRDAWLERAREIAESGRRLIAVAERTMSEADSEIGDLDGAQSLTLLGLFALVDPPRAEVATAIADCKSAGIGIKVITGDHAGTARAVATEIGVGGALLTGTEIDQMDDDTLRDRVLETDIYARTSPVHKLRLVEALQSLGAVTVMTGDGVNDAPALKRSDVGVAMGIKGTEVSKEAAEMVLADDDFSSITHAVREGRTVHDNITKAIAFILPTSFAAAALVIAAVLVGTALPITPVQILWINLVTTVTLALALGFERPERNIMRRPPRDPGEPILSAYLLWRIFLVSVVFLIGVFALFEWSLQRGASLDQARTVAVNAIVFFEVFYLFNTRKLQDSVFSYDGIFGSRACLIAVAVVIALQMVFTFAPGFGVLFKAAPLDLTTFAVLILAASSVFWIVEAEKAIARRLAGKPAAQPAR